MKGKTMPASRGSADGGAPSKTQDDKDFLARWIAFGMSLKGRADGYGIEWRGTSFEKYMAEVSFTETWHETKEKECARM